VLVNLIGMLYGPGARLTPISNKNFFISSIEKAYTILHYPPKIVFHFPPTYYH
jgi:hypothetical protein